MPVVSTNLIQGPATIYTAVFGATEPTPFVSGAPAVAWTDVGGTSEGVTLNVETEWSDLTVDQLLDVVGRRRIGRKVTVSTILAEPTLANLALAINNSAPAANVMELDDGVTAFQPVYGAILLDGVAPGGFKRRIVLRKTLSIENVEMSYKKDGMTLIPVTWGIHYVSSSIKAVKWEDATS